MPPQSRTRPVLGEWRYVALLRILFLAIAMVHLDGPFVSMHFVRQNQTFDVAQHVFHEGWSAVINPKASFSQLASPDDLSSRLTIPMPRFTIIHLEVPFHGLIGWPAAMIFKAHERAVVRLVSVAFALLSINIFYLVLRYWHEPPSALMGTALWTTAPLIVYFGQVPMPDILATTGMAGAFLLALRGNLAGSSCAFLFALLAKLSVIIYGLPILVALLIAKDCKSMGRLLAISFAWGIGPLLGVIAWLSISRHDPPGSWVIVGGYSPGQYGTLHLRDLINPKLYITPLVLLFPFGCGIIGALGLMFALGYTRHRINPWLKASIVLAVVCNYVFEYIAWVEPQYSVPVLFWLILAGSWGFPPLVDRLRESTLWRVGGACALLLQVLTVCLGVAFLKAPRVPNLTDLEAAGALTPADSRIVYYGYCPSACPSVWTNRNTLKFNPQGNFNSTEQQTVSDQLKRAQLAGFDYLMVFDMEPPRKMSLAPHQAPSYATDLTSLSSQTRQFFDGRFPKEFEGNHVILYSLKKL